MIKAWEAPAVSVVVEVDGRRLQLERMTARYAVFSAPSSSEHGQLHRMYLTRDEWAPDGRSVRCTCKGFMFKSKCWHATAARRAARVLRFWSDVC